MVATKRRPRALLAFRRGRPPPENGARARDATYLGALRDARVFRRGDLRVVRGRGRSETTRQRRTRRASAAEGTGTRREVVRGENAGGVRLGARRERRRTMMGDSYFTSVSTGGIGMAPGLLRRKRTARALLVPVETRASPRKQRLGKSERKALLSFRFSLVSSANLPNCLAACVDWKSSRASQAEPAKSRGARMGFYLELLFDLHLCLSDDDVRARERVTAQRAALIRVVARQGPDHASSVSSS